MVAIVASGLNVISLIFKSAYCQSSGFELTESLKGHN